MVTILLKLKQVWDITEFCFLIAAKNLILAGVKSVTLHDEGNVELWDLSSNFIFTEEDVGKNRALASVQKLQELNNSVIISTLTDALATEQLSNFQASRHLLDVIDLTTTHIFLVLMNYWLYNCFIADAVVLDQSQTSRASSINFLHLFGPVQLYSVHFLPLLTNYSFRTYKSKKLTKARSKL